MHPAKMFGTEFHREEFADQLASELRILRAGAKLSQEEVAHAVGITRQTYYAYENQTRKIPWDKCLAILFYFESIPESQALLKAMDLLPESQRGHLVSDSVG